MESHTLDALERSADIYILYILQPNLIPGPHMILGPEAWQPVAACGGLWRPSRSPIEEDKMIRSFDLSILAPRSWIPAAWVHGGQDSSISAAWLPWLAGLMSSAGPCFEGWDLEGDGCSRLGSGVSHARCSGEVGGYVAIACGL